MNPRQRDRFIGIVVSDLDKLSADFERFGYQFMDQYHPSSWDHRGTTVSGAPAKSTIDSTGAGVDKAAEYSSDANYFADVNLKKLKLDIDHVVKMHPSVTQAWMLGSRLATGGQMTRAKRVAANYLPLKIEVLDARRIAEFVVDNLSNHDFITKIAPYLPFLGRLRNEWALSHQIPVLEYYVPRPHDEDGVRAALQSRRVVVVTGISGLGKSALCAQVARDAQANDDYELVLWHDAGDLRDVADLGAVYVDGHGERENLLSHLKLRKCLLVLDNVTSDDIPRRVLAASSAETKVLATSQVTTCDEDAFVLHPVDRPTARQIITGDLTECPDEVFERVYDRVAGHPLVLRLLGNEVSRRSGDWAVAEQLSRADAHQLIDERRQRVCMRVLEQHQDVLSAELAFVSWCATPLMDAALLAGVCGALSADALRERHFISAEPAGTLRINDLVFESICSMTSCPPDMALRFAKRLAAFVEKHVCGEGEDKLPFLRASRVHRDLFRRTLRHEGSSVGARSLAALRYAYASARDAETDLEVLGDAVAEAESLAAEDGAAEGGAIRVRALIEAIETSFSITKARAGGDAAVSRHKTLLAAFGTLKAIKWLSPPLLREVVFHEAKALLWARDDDAAQKTFESLLVDDPGLVAARVQLGRVYAKRSRKRAGPDADAVVEQFEAIINEPTAPVTVVLAGYELLASLGGEVSLPLIQAHRSQLIAQLRQAVAARLEQPYRLVASLGRVLWYFDGQLLDDLFNTVAGSAAPATDDATTFAWAQAQKQHAKSKLERGSNEGEVTSLLNEAVASYEQIRRLNDFQRVQYAECLNLAGRAPEALSVLEGAEGPRSAHWQHRAAQALRSLGRHDEARAAIDEAISADNVERFMSTFLRERWLVRKAQSDADAIVDLREAHRRCAPGKYRDQLQAELELAESGQG